MLPIRLGSALGVMLLLGVGCAAEKVGTSRVAVSKERTLLTSRGEAGFSFEEHYPYVSGGDGRDACRTVLTTDAATETVAFSDASAGFSMDVPYNPLWGNDQYRVGPFELALADQRFYFGPLRVWSGERTCSWYRNVLYLLEPRTEKEQVNDQRLEAQNTGWDVKALELRTIGSVKVVDTLHAEVAGVACHTLTVLGKKYNYRLTSCGDLPDVERMLGTMKILD